MRGQQPWRTNRARVLRNKQTSAEQKLWSRIRNRQLAGMKFSRQTPIGDYFADFVCRKHNIIVEVDGATHGTHLEVAQDAERERYLLSLGYHVFRVTNQDIFENLDGVIEGLLRFAQPIDD